MALITKYLLPCECGQQVPVELGQAGQTVVCSCGKSLEVPTMRGIRGLEPVQVETAKRAGVGESNWSATRGVLFSLGLLVGVVALGFAGLEFYSLHQIGPIITEDEATVVIDEMIAEYDAEQAFDLWTSYRAHGLGPQHPPHYVQMQHIASRIKKAIAVSLILSAIGFAIAVGTIRFPRKLHNSRS